jgi:hypothetical protein
MSASLSVRPAGGLLTLLTFSFLDSSIETTSGACDAATRYQPHSMRPTAGGDWPGTLQNQLFTIKIHIWRLRRRDNSPGSLGGTSWGCFVALYSTSLYLILLSKTTSGACDAATRCQPHSVRPAGDQFRSHLQHEQSLCCGKLFAPTSLAVAAADQAELRLASCLALHAWRVEQPRHCPHSNPLILTPISLLHFTVFSPAVRAGAASSTHRGFFAVSLPPTRTFTDAFGSQESLTDAFLVSPITESHRVTIQVKSTHSHSVGCSPARLASIQLTLRQLHLADTRATPASAHRPLSTIAHHFSVSRWSWCFT